MMKKARKHVNLLLRGKPTGEGVLGVALLAAGILAGQILITWMRSLPKTTGLEQACALWLGSSTIILLLIFGATFSVNGVRDTCKKASQK